MNKGFACILIAIFLCSNHGFSQKEFTNWYFGDKAGINFFEGEVTILDDSSISATEACAVISDASGNLLFYTNGINVWDRTHNVMPNGQDINNLDGPINLYSTQGAVIVPRPNNPNIYFIFTGSTPFVSDGLRYSEVDLSLNEGQGDVTSNRSILLNSGPSVGKITAVQHANNKDFWIITHGQGNSNFYVYKIDENGVSDSPLTFNIGSVHELGLNSTGALKVSPDARRLAIAASDLSPNGFLEVFDFNDETGAISGDVLRFDTIFLDDFGAPYGIEFSPNSQYLYVSDYNIFVIDGIQQPNFIYQLDLSFDTVEEINLNRSTISSKDEVVGALQLGEDERIYVSYRGSPFLDVISSPNNSGLLADYVSDAVPLRDDDLDQQSAFLGLPQDIRQFFYLNLIDNPVCGGTAYDFSFETNEEPISVLWDFNDGTTSNGLNPTHSFLPGTYVVELSATYESSVIIRTVLIEIPEVGDYNNEIILCDDASNDGVVVLTLDELNNTILGNQQCGITTYHLTAADAEANLNPLEVSFTATNNQQIIYLRLEQEFNSNNVTIIPIITSVSNSPTLLSESYAICNVNGEASVSISTAEFDDFFDGNLNCVNITYHLTNANAESAINPIIGSLDIQGESQTIFIRIESLIDNSYTVQSFTLVIIAKPVINLEDTYYLCHNETVNLQLDSGYDSYLWSTGADTSALNIDTSGSYSVTVSNESIEGECSETKIFNVVVSDVPEVVTLEVNDLSSNNSIEIIAEGIGIYEYSLNGIDYQTSPIFENLLASQYTVYIRDVKGCGMVTEEVFLLVYPKFFTPNNDGKNDYWQVKSAFTEPNLSIEIYDRYGKLYYTFKGSSPGWDGTFNGSDLPSNDYWFKITRPSKNKVYRGHFTLKR